MSPARLGALMFAVFAAGLLAGLAAGWSAARGGAGRKVAEVVELVGTKYYRGVDEESQVEAALRGMARSLDPWSDYFTARQWKAFSDEHLEGTFSGVGIQVEWDRETETLRVVTPMDQSPALKAGIRSGDRISAVDGRPVKGMTYEAVLGMIRGPKGTSVRLTVLREGREPFDVSVVRETLKLKKLLQARIEREGRPPIAYVRPTEFTEGISEATAAALRALGGKGVIVDVRQNPGGLLDECVRMSGLFVGRRAIVKTQSRIEEQERLSPVDALPELADVPVVVLIDEGSASASEIFAGALQDYGAAVLVGKRTFGKGSVQESHRLSDESRFKLTVAIYKLPKGRSGADSKYAIEPDHAVEISPEQADERAKWWGLLHSGTEIPPPPADDPQLKKALELLDDRLGN